LGERTADPFAALGDDNASNPVPQIECATVNQKRETAFAKDEAIRTIPTIATAVVI
jgi:hypothetical protein